VTWGPLPKGRQDLEPLDYLGEGLRAALQRTLGLPVDFQLTTIKME